MTEGPPFAPRLLRWFDRHRRDLPWRRAREPWAIWVSEVMLQQTRVEAVREPFVRFMQRYPTPAAFASASDDELLLAWRGLGYYRRARLLRDAAREVVAAHGGVVPARIEQLATLPGVGAYTLGAVASIAFGQAEVAVDGNVERVVARHRGLRTAIDGAVRRTIRRTAGQWMERARPGDFNQALMELGATVCTPTSPDCERCPVAADCVARRQGLTAVLPVRPKPRAAVDVESRVVLVLDGAQALGHRIATGQANTGQVELPGGGMLASIDRADLAHALASTFGARLCVGDVIATVRHAITNHRIVLRAHAATLRRRGTLQWFAIAASTPWTTPSRKVFRAVLGADGALRA